MSGLFCIWRSGKAEEQMRVIEIRDTRYEELEEQIRVNGMRDTKSRKSKSKSELEDKRFDKQ
ncbi:hypothetical protein AB6D76_09720 [Vibrio splendidus]|uniref:hypothetical protein n=1 Tax=Vibrio splendidus TaxID=29497 RepID=UPI000C819F5C|nr:hypothetical protein [Vibrio splendidus]PMI28610.1 hypothetical protein BCU48_15350 [Vibrio splendidus]